MQEMLFPEVKLPQLFQLELRAVVLLVYSVSHLRVQERYEELIAETLYSQQLQNE